MKRGKQRTTNISLLWSENSNPQGLEVVDVAD